MTELTLEDIAKQVGVSRSTVSRVVNGSPNVSPEVRQQVLEAIRITGFHPNAAARSLASQRTRVIGLVLPRSVSSFFTDPFFPQLTQGIALGCNTNDLSLSLFLVTNKEDEDKIMPRISRSGMLDGILVQSGRADDPLMERLTSSRIPCVILGRPFKDAGISYVDVDNVKAAYVATKHLTDLGYKHIATITGSHGSTVTLDRIEGYTKALTDAGYPINPFLIAKGEFSETSGYEAMMNLLPHKPDAIFIASDLMASGAIRALQDSGLHVPEDIALVGFDDIPLAALTKIRLTTVRQPIPQIGTKAVELLIDLIENGTQPSRNYILETELIVRDSCGAKIQQNA